jgi:hypothetical protein
MIENPYFSEDIIDLFTEEDVSEELLEQYNSHFEEYIESEMKWYNSLL